MQENSVQELLRAIEAGVVTEEMIVKLLTHARNPYLKLVRMNVLITGTNGVGTIVRSDHVFSVVDSAFVEWGIDVPDLPTRPMHVRVYEMDPRKCEASVTFPMLFTSLGRFDELSLTQHQIVTFCEHHQNLLRTDGFATFFPFMVGISRFVASVSVQGDSMTARAYRFESENQWRAKHGRRIVVLE